MANIRNLKKEVKYLAADLINECNSFLNFHQDTDRKKIDQIISKITKKEQELIYEINHLKNKASEKSKAYIGRITEKVKKEMIPLLDEIGKLSDK